MPISTHLPWRITIISSATSAIFPNGNLQADDYHLGDVNFWVNTEGELYTIDAFTGAVETDVGALPSTHHDIVMRIDGQLYTPLAKGERVVITSLGQSVRFVRNTALGYWGRLMGKMNWAATPRSQRG